MSPLMTYARKCNQGREPKGTQGNPEASLEYINSAGWFLIICLGFVILALIVVIITGLVKDEAEFDPTLPTAGILLIR